MNEQEKQELDAFVNALWDEKVTDVTVWLSDGSLVVSSKVVLSTFAALLDMAKKADERERWRSLSEARPEPFQLCLIEYNIFHVEHNAERDASCLDKSGETRRTDDEEPYYKIKPAFYMPDGLCIPRLDMFADDCHRFADGVLAEAVTRWRPLSDPMLDAWSGEQRRAYLRDSQNNAVLRSLDKARKEASDDEV